MSASLTAVYLKGQGRDWLETVARALGQRRREVVLEESRLRVWSSDRIGQLSSSVSYVDGCQIRSIWVGGHRRAIGLLPIRLYLDSAGTPIQERESVILGNAGRPRAEVHDSIQWMRALMSTLSESCPELIDRQIRLESVSEELEASASISANGESFEIGTKLRSILGEVGYDKVPKGMSVVIVSEPSVSSATAVNFVDRVKASCDQHKLAAKVCVVSAEKLRKRLDDLRAGSSVRSTSSPVWFLLRSKSKSPSSEIIHLMEQLDRFDLRWRRAYADDDFQWSIGDQLGSIVQAAGGRNYSIKLASGRLPWSIGLDISHGRGTRPHSTVCAALVDPTGSLVHAWKRKQSRNEAISAVAVRKLLLAATDYARAESKYAEVLVLRDGRLFDSENAGFYRDRLGSRVSLVEVRKRQNPLFLCEKDNVCPKSASYGAIPSTFEGTNVGLLITSPCGNERGFDTPLKIHWRDQWDGLGIGPKDLPAMLVALTAAPGLGLHPRTLPAPIYWADGLAAASDKNLKFRGQEVSWID